VGVFFSFSVYQLQLYIIEWKEAALTARVNRGSWRTWHAGRGNLSA